MAERSMAFRFIGEDKSLGRTLKEISHQSDNTEHKLKNVAKVAGAAFAGMATVVVGAGVAALKAAGDFQESQTALVTGAGETQKNLALVSKGVLDMAGKVGFSADALSKGLYLIESSGKHGAEGLLVLKAAAEGARVGGADMATVADGLTTALNDYRIPASQAALVTSKLVATVAAGKTHMADLSGALATVLPAASTAGIGLNEVLGAMATMTSLGTPAADAATYLKQTISQLVNPTAKARKEMSDLGISALDVQQNIGKRGLTGTFGLLTDAITKHMGPSGTVLIDQLQKAAKTSKDYEQVTSKTTKTTTGWVKATTTAKMVGGDLTTTVVKVTNAHGKLSTATTQSVKQHQDFLSIIADLPPKQQVYVQALATMVGGTKSMQAALELTGTNAKTFNDNVKNIGGTVLEAGGHVSGFAATQKDFNVQLDNAKAAFHSLVIEVGDKALPVVTTFMEQFNSDKGTGGSVKDFFKQVGHDAKAFADGVEPVFHYIGDHPHMFTQIAEDALILGGVLKAKSFLTGMGLLKGGGSIAGLGGAAAKVDPMGVRVFVTNEGFAGGKGAPVPVGGGKTPPVVVPPKGNALSRALGIGGNVLPIVGPILLTSGDSAQGQGKLTKMQNDLMKLANDLYRNHRSEYTPDFEKQYRHAMGFTHEGQTPLELPKGAGDPTAGAALLAEYAHRASVKRAADLAGEKRAVGLLTGGLDEALTKADLLQAKLDALHGKKIVIDVALAAGGNGTAVQGRGGKMLVDGPGPAAPHPVASRTTHIDLRGSTIKASDPVALYLALQARERLAALGGGHGAVL